MPFGAYLYWRAGEDPELQVDWFFEICKKHIDLPPAIDVERYNNVGVLSKQDAGESILEVAMLLEDVYNVPALLYTSWWSWESLTGSYDLAGVLPIWVANWTSHHTPLLPRPAQEWEFWQFTNAYPLPGQPRTCDANRFNGSQSAFDEYVRVNRGLMYPDTTPPPDGGNDGEPIYIEFRGERLVGEVKSV